MVHAPFTLLVSGPRQSGKSSLLAQAISKLVAQGQQVVYLDLQQADGQIFESFAEWAYFLARQLHRQTRRGSAPTAGQFDHSPMVLLTEFVEDQILSDPTVPLALVLDEVDRVFGRPISIEAFSLLRGWHNNRAQKPSLWKQVSLLLAHSTQPYLWIPDNDRSPFNVGARIELEDFTIDQVRAFIQRVNGAEVSDENLQRIYELTGGQPFLSRLALHHLLTTKTDLDEQRTAGETGILGDHLRAIGFNLNKRPELITSLRQVMAEGRCSDEKHFQRLLAAGLVRGANRDRVQVHRGLYRSYFRSLT
jgi:AAA+ ATPase superfamily predicted ATPase